MYRSVFSLHLLSLMVLFSLIVACSASSESIEPTVTSISIPSTATLTSEPPTTTSTPSLPTATHTPELPTATHTPELPTATPIPPTPISRPTLAIVPTPTPLPQAELTTLRDLCEASFSEEKPTANTLTGKVAILINEIYSDTDWEIFDYQGFKYKIPYHMVSRSLFDLSSIVCIEKDRKSAGSYSDGEKAYRIQYIVRIISWPNGEVIAANNFKGSDPPISKSKGGGPGYGAPPHSELVAWLKSLISPPEQQGITFIDHLGEIEDLSFSPDGKLLAVADGSNGTVTVWEVETGKETITFAGQTVGDNNIVFSPDGKWLLSVCYGDGTVQVWEVKTGKEVITLQSMGYSDRIESRIIFSPDGKWLAGSDRNDDTVKVWEMETGNELITFRTEGYNNIVFSPDGKWLAGTSRKEDNVKLWETITGEETATLIGHRESVGSIAFSPDGKLLASGGLDGKVILWEVKTGKQVEIPTDHMSERMGQIFYITFSLDGKTLASGGHSLLLWDIEASREIFYSPQSAYSMVFSPDGSLVVGISDNGKAILWEVETGREITNYDLEAGLGEAWVTFLPDERLLGVSYLYETLLVWITEMGGEMEKTILPVKYTVTTFSPDKKLLALGTDEGNVILWEATER